jgi:hypothetical protein
VNRADRTSDRPTTFATASDFDGETANRSAASSAADGSTPQRTAMEKTSQQTAAWRIRLIAWDTEGLAAPVAPRSRAKLATGDGPVKRQVATQ